MNYVLSEEHMANVFTKPMTKKEILNSFEEHYGNSIKFAERELYIVSLWLLW